MHYYQFNIGDYLSHTGHLDLLEDLAYRRMIEWCYLHESPLPLDVKQIAKKIRMQEHCDCITAILQEFFCDGDDGWFNERVAKELKSYKSLSTKRKKAANKRWANNGKASKGDASALQVESTSIAKQEPLTNNHKPLTITKDIGDKSPAKAKTRFVEPALIDVQNYFLDKTKDREQSGIEGMKFHAYYESNGWKVGKNKMKSWQSAATGWIARNITQGNTNEINGRPTTERPDMSATGRTRTNGEKRRREIDAQIAEISGNDRSMEANVINLSTQMDVSNGRQS